MTKKYADDDLVNIVIITTHSNYLNLRVNRGWASEQLRSWWIRLNAVREGEMKCKDKVLTKEEAQHELTTGGLAINQAYGIDWKEGEPTWCRAVVPWANIVAMYIQEEGIKSAADRLADAVEKQIEEGDEWKRGENED